LGDLIRNRSGAIETSDKMIVKKLTNNDYIESYWDSVEIGEEDLFDMCACIFPTDHLYGVETGKFYEDSSEKMIYIIGQSKANYGIFIGEVTDHIGNTTLIYIDGDLTLNDLWFVPVTGQEYTERIKKIYGVKEN